MLPKETEHTSELSFLKGGGEMGHLIRSIDWSTTPLGEPNLWPSALKYSVSMMLATNIPMLICWGHDYIQLYNNAFRPILGETSHPQAMGLGSNKTFAEIWPAIKPLFERVMKGGTADYPDFMVPLNRNGCHEDCHFEFSYSPVKDETATVRGILAICTETTAKVRGLDQAKQQQANEEIAAANEELVSTNEELAEMQVSLQKLVQALTRSEANLRDMILQSPVAMGLFSGKIWCWRLSTTNF